VTFCNQKLKSLVLDSAPVVIAVSGGIDSLCLAAFCHSLLGGERCFMFHGRSPSVPRAAYERLLQLTEKESWNLQLIDSGELDCNAYRDNPVNRCYFCKNYLYQAIKSRTDAQIFSGANADDLDDYRPGLIAAGEHGVRHPFIEVGLDKAAVRELAKEVGLSAYAEIPASPCLSSRVETGIKIAGDVLLAVDAVEEKLGRLLDAQILRCRVRSEGVVIELDENSLRQGMSQEEGIRKMVVKAFAGVLPVGFQIRLQVYQRGSAFVGKPKCT
jgi:uncharacterized protein